MFDLQEIKRAASEEVLRQMPAAVIVVEAPSGKIIFSNREGQQWTEQVLGQSVPQELGEYRDLQASANFKMLHPDRRLYKIEEWPLTRSITSGEEVRGEVIIHLLDDGTELWSRYDSSPIYDEEERLVAGVAAVYDITEQKRAEEELRESKRRIENILESTTDAFFALDREWRFTYINERGVRQLQGGEGEGLTREEFLGESAWELFPELVGSVFYHKYHEALREQKTVDFEAYSPPSEKWFEVHAYPSEEGLAIYRRDVTERKRMEEALQESSRRNEEILESITDGFCAMDHHWRFTYLNARAVRLASQVAGEEFTREGLLGRTLWETLPAVVGTSIEEQYRWAVREQQTAVFEYPYPGGGPIFEVYAYPSEQGLSIYFRDITERKRAQKEIEGRTQQQAVVAELGLQALTNDSLQTLLDDAVALVARTLGVEYSKIVEALPGGEEMLLRAGAGWEEGLVGNATESAGPNSEAGYTIQAQEPVIVEDVHAETRFEPSELIREHAIVSGMAVVIHGREEPFGVLCAHAANRRPFSEDDANFLQAVANVLATTIERKEAEERLREVREAERSRIARDLHDEALRDLSGALVEAQRLQQSIPEDPELTRRTGRMLAALDRMGPQLRATIYNLRLGGEQERPFRELLESFVELQRAMIPECEILLEVGGGSLSGSLGRTGTELLRILGEALTNARRHSGAQNIQVTVGTSEDPKLLWAEVLDDGRGFDPTEEPPAATTTGGMGIRGMRERALALGGNLKIESEPGKGTRARFELALEEEDREEPDGEGGVGVLLVEDHATVREALAAAFEREAGFEVVGQAGSIAEARGMLGAEQPLDVAVVDLGLPDGYGGDWAYPG